MSESILQCSGGHWIRAALTWTCLAIAVVVSLPRSNADEPRRHRAAKAETAISASSHQAAQWEPRTTVTHRVTSFDFNAVDIAAYGDAEASEPQQADR